MGIFLKKMKTNFQIRTITSDQSRFLTKSQITKINDFISEIQKIDDSLSFLAKYMNEIMDLIVPIRSHYTKKKKSEINSINDNIQLSKLIQTGLMESLQSYKKLSVKTKIDDILDQEINHLKPLIENIFKKLAGFKQGDLRIRHRFSEEDKDEVDLIDAVKKKSCIDNKNINLNAYANTYETNFPNNTQPEINLKASKGLFGLKNLGNTCFFNSSLQCLSHTKTFHKLFIEEVNHSELLKKQQNLSQEFSSIMNQMWLSETEAKFITPSNLFMEIGKLNPKVNFS